MPDYRVVIGTPGGNLEYVLEAVSVSIARQAAKGTCLPGCRVASVEPGDGGDAATVPGGGSGPRKPPLQAHAHPPEGEPA